MGVKGVRSKRGKGELYEEAKTVQVIILLTSEGARLLNEKVKNYRTDAGETLSRSEYFERYAREIL